MARIRTVKPSFFRHEELQELEVQNPGSYIMLVFQGIWTLSDSKGRFLYKPRQMKLDILPFIPFDFESTLKILEMNGFIEVYEVDGVKYGRVPTFLEHQRLTGKESLEGEKYPDPNGETEGKQQGSTGETPEKHPVAQEEEGKGGRSSSPKKISEFNMKDCKLDPDSPEYKVYQTSSILYEKFRKRFPHNKDLPDTPLLDWIVPIRELMRDKEYTPEQIDSVAGWAVNDKFWKKNILNTEALAKHFEKLKLEYQDARQTQT